jgi:hypothetical protein
MQGDERAECRERRLATSGPRSSGLRPREPDALGDGGSSWVRRFGAGSVRVMSKLAFALVTAADDDLTSPVTKHLGDLAKRSDDSCCCGDGCTRATLP